MTNPRVEAVLDEEEADRQAFLSGGAGKMNNDAWDDLAGDCRHDALFVLPPHAHTTLSRPHLSFLGGATKS